MNEPITQFNVNRNYSFTNEELPKTVEDFASTAASVLAVLKRPAQRELLSVNNGGVMYARPKSSSNELNRAANVFSQRYIGDEGVDISNPEQLYYLKQKISPIVSDPKIIKQITELENKIDNIYQSKLPNNISQPQISDLQDKRKKLIAKNDEFIEKNIKTIAASLGKNTIFTAKEFADFIRKTDKNSNGLVDNYEER